jgi:hypothetical protein
MADSNLEMGSSKTSSERRADREPSWYPPGSVLELTIHMSLDPRGFVDVSNTDLLVALAKIVKIANRMDFMMRPRIIDVEDSFYLE